MENHSPVPNLSSKNVPLVEVNGPLSAHFALKPWLSGLSTDLFILPAVVEGCVRKPKPLNLNSKIRRAGVELVPERRC